MQVEALKTKPRQLTLDVSTYGIQSWGYCNDYPNRVLETIACSPTALLCAETYQRFQEGKGFKDKTFWEENDEILTNICIVLKFL